MKKALLLASALCLGLFLTLGCRKAAPASSPGPAAKSAAAGTPAAATPAAAEWTPVVKGRPYQLSLQDGRFGFCDDRGAEMIELATGRQTAGSQACDARHEVVQSRCDEQVQLIGQPDAGDDDLAINDNDYRLHGHDNACDREGQVVIAATYGAVEVIDAAANKVAIVNPQGGDKAVIGSGWVAWNSLDAKHPLGLETVAKAMEHAATPKE